MSTLGDLLMAPFWEQLGDRAEVMEHGDPQTMPRAEYEAKYHPGPGVSEEQAAYKGDWRRMFKEETPFASFPKPDKYNTWRDGAARLDEMGFTARIDHTFALTPQGIKDEGVRPDVAEGANGIYLTPDDSFLWVDGRDHVMATIGLSPTFGTGWDPADEFCGSKDLGDVFRHEYAHYLMDRLDTPKGWAAKAQIKALVTKWRFGGNLGADEVTRLLSAYAASDVLGNELWAEAFRVMTSPAYKQGTLPFDDEVFRILREQGLMR